MPSLPEVQAQARVWDQGDHLYITAPLQLWTPDVSQIEELAFVDTVRNMSPNENIVWLRGQYVEADNPNANGAEWTAGELSIKALTPRLMPVTVMHDPSTAVGVIADAKLLTPEADKVERARIDTVLALWGHRFPDAVGEAVHNARNGMLMQSMEDGDLPVGVLGGVRRPLHQAAGRPGAGHVVRPPQGVTSVRRHRRLEGHARTEGPEPTKQRKS